MGNCHAIVQQQDAQEATQMLRRLAIQRRMVGQKLGQAVIDARQPKNRSRAAILLKKVKTLQNQHHALDSVETQLETITDINATHTVLSSVSSLFSVDAHLPDIDAIGDIQDALADSQERCAEVDQALRDGFSSAQVPDSQLTASQIQSELDLILGLVDDPRPPPPAGSTPLEKRERQGNQEIKTKTKLIFPAPPEPIPSPIASTSRQVSQGSGAPKEKQQGRTEQKPRLVLS
tara:strand:+ start:67 stop:765 length:699 start_codon:yes stop_codon:yes gene_type:complete